jgi:hypothetical protein
MQSRLKEFRLMNLLLRPSCQQLLCKQVRQASLAPPESTFSCMQKYLEKAAKYVDDQNLMLRLACEFYQQELDKQSAVKDVVHKYDVQEVVQKVVHKHNLQKAVAFFHSQFLYASARFWLEKLCQDFVEYAESNSWPVGHGKQALRKESNFDNKGKEIKGVVINAYVINYIVYHQELWKKFATERGFLQEFPDIRGENLYADLSSPARR